MAGLPAPVTTTDHLLTAVHTELVGLRADLASSRGGETAPPAEPGGQIDITEPKPSRPAARQRASTTPRG